MATAFDGSKVDYHYHTDHAFSADLDSAHVYYVIHNYIYAVDQHMLRILGLNAHIIQTLRYMPVFKGTGPG